MTKSVILKGNIMENMAWICTERAELLLGNGLVGHGSTSRNLHSGSHPSFTLNSSSFSGGITERTLRLCSS